MKLSLVHLAALALPLGCLVGCSAAPESSAEDLGSSSSAIITVPNGGVLQLTPLAACTGIPASETTTYVPGEPVGEPMHRQGAASAGCDYTVFEVNGTQGTPVSIGLSDMWPPESGENDAPPSGVVDAASCAQSYLTYESMGYRPPTFTVVGTSVIEVPGEWVEIGSSTIYGTWSTAENRCAFFPLELPQEDSPAADGPLWLPGSVASSPYSTIRVATRFNLVEPAGDAWPFVYVYLR